MRTSSYVLSDLEAWMSSRKVRFRGTRLDLSTLDHLKQREQAIKLRAEISRMKARLSRLQRRLAKDGIAASRDEGDGTE